MTSDDIKCEPFRDIFKNLRDIEEEKMGENTSMVRYMVVLIMLTTGMHGNRRTARFLEQPLISDILTLAKFLHNLVGNLV